ncbi:hypothetical protein IX51_07575 [uncultured archaeon]|nr:hypothetical protein IX51_07575 [uncultured archaeon]HKJ97248.1 cation-efflux pump [Thermoplasmataceae archaeon]
MDRGAVLKTGSIVVLSVNVALFVYKLIIGVYIHSYALVSDSFNSLTDALVGLSMFAGITYAYMPPDEEHTFGHGRAEYVVLFVLAATLIATGAAILGGEYFDIRHLAVIRYSTLYVILIAITIPVKFFLGVYVSRLGKEKSAEFMSADYWHEQSDNLVTGAVIVGLILSGQGYNFVDPAIGAAIALFLIYLGFSYGRKSINQLMGGFQSKDLIDKARLISLGIKGVRDIGKIEVHEYGERVVVNITIVLSGNLDASSAHAISHMVQDELTNNGFYSAHVHVDTRRTALIEDIEKSIKDLINQEEEIVGFHGLEIRESLGTSIAELHLVFERNITLEKAHDVAHKLDERFRQKFPGYRLLTHIEPRS